MDDVQLPPGIDPHVPNVARMYDYYLGGKDNFQADRDAAEQMIEIGRKMGNDAREVARENREFLGRAVRHLAEEGMDRFIDIGAGLPTQENVHTVAQRHRPDARIVYIDNDPVVLSHAQALLADNPGTIALAGDLRRPAEIFADEAVRRHLDLGRPLTVLVVAVLHFIPDDEAAAVMAEIRDRLPSGGHLVLSHLYLGDIDPEVLEAGRRVYSTTSSGGVYGRDLAQITAFFDGLELLDPGIVPVQAWRPEVPWDVPVDLSRPGILGAVARKP